MGWIIFVVAVVAMLASLIGKAGSAMASPMPGKRADDDANGEFSSSDDYEDDRKRSRLFDDDDFSSSSILSGASMCSDSTTGSMFSDSSVADCTPSVNPANGLPMIGCIDIEGNPFGTDSLHWDDHSISCHSSMDDSFSSSCSSIFDDNSFSCSSTSSFDD